MKIAIASSGLGHVKRGIETWAADLARALHNDGRDATLFGGAGKPTAAYHETLPCRTRFEPRVQRLTARMEKVGGWRWGCGSGYQWEQTTFTLPLWKRIRRDYDILHVQDPHIALLMENLWRRGLSRPRVILAHGTEEPTEYLQKFSFLQHLAPCYLEDWKAVQPKTQQAFVIPNFVQTDVFAPGDKAKARAEFDLPQDALIVLCVAAIKSGHKRIDALIREFARFVAPYRKPALLVVAGAREQETDEIVALGQSLLGEQVRFLEGVPRDRISALYRTADIFALSSLHEMMPIALLEALSSGLPITANDTPTLRWMAGAAGCLNDISKDGALAAQWKRLTDPDLRREYSHAARAHALSEFGERAVLEQILTMYKQVMETRRP
jgi:1,2-diacylglycerol 3-alpha-glucosyltransferase